MHQQIEEYKANGFTVLTNTASRIGSVIAISADSTRIAKFSQDPAYDNFVKFVQRQAHSKYLPVVFSHDEHGGSDEIGAKPWFTITEMEKLEELTSPESDALIPWLQSLFEAIRKHHSLASFHDDPFGLLLTMSQLWDYARALGNGFDILKTSNFMAREFDGDRNLVITDPYN
jgi:hypothetical protein